jgi:hypothetical protein
VMARRPRLADRSKTGASRWHDPPGTESPFAIEHGLLQ